MHSIALHNVGGAPYCLKISIRSWWLVVRYAFTGSTNATNVGRLCWCLRWRRDLRVKLPSWHPTFGVAPNCVRMPCLSRYLNARSFSFPFFHSFFLLLGCWVPAPGYASVFTSLLYNGFACTSKVIMFNPLWTRMKLHALWFR